MEVVEMRRNEEGLRPLKHVAGLEEARLWSVKTCKLLSYTGNGKSQRRLLPSAADPNTNAFTSQWPHCSTQETTYQRIAQESNREVAVRRQVKWDDLYKSSVIVQHSLKDNKRKFSCGWKKGNEIGNQSPLFLFLMYSPMYLLMLFFKMSL